MCAGACLGVLCVVGAKRRMSYIYGYTLHELYAHVLSRFTTFIVYTQHVCVCVCVTMLRIALARELFSNKMLTLRIFAHVRKVNLYFCGVRALRVNARRNAVLLALLSACVCVAVVAVFTDAVSVHDVYIWMSRHGSLQTRKRATFCVVSCQRIYLRGSTTKSISHRYALARDVTRTFRITFGNESTNVI